MTPYHRGELAAQEKAGVVDDAARLAGMFRRDVPRAAQEFLARQPLVVVGATDPRGDVWATMLTGEPGFLSVEEPSTLVVRAVPPLGDPLHDVLAAPARVGLIGIEPATRRRVRMNGTSSPAADGLRIDLAQVYANCPKYIQARHPHQVAGPAGPVRSGSGLEPEDLELVRGADTFFVATADLDGDADASHRGGRPGFLKASDPTHLRWPDYVGNSMFNTIGNLEVNPRAGLLVPDWSTGALLHLTGHAHVDWDREHAAAVPGAQRIVDFTVERAVRVDRASSLRWTEPEPSRFNPPAP